MSGTEDPRKVEAALKYCDPDSDREEWLNRIMEIKNGLGEAGKDIAQSWSQQSGRFNARSFESEWKSIDPDGERKVGSLYSHAMANGWKAQAEGFHTPDYQPAFDKTAKGPQRARSVRKVWKPADPQHPYLIKKGVKPSETLFQASAQTIKRKVEYAPKNPKTKTPLEGVLLVVPLYQADELSGLELIDSEGAKTAIEGSMNSSSYWPAQTMPTAGEPVREVVVAEGVATALSIKEANPALLVVAALSNTNLEKVTKVMQKRYIGARLTIAADLDKHKNFEVDATAVKAAEKTGARLVYPSAGLGVTDFNDLHQLKGLDEVRQCLEKAPEKERSGFRFIDVYDLEDTPPDWLVQDFFECDSLAEIFGEPKSGKSFVAFDLALSVATGKDWHGQKVKQGPVLIIAGEGKRGIKRRIKAWEKQNGVKVPRGALMISDRAAALTDAGSLAQVLEGISETLEQCGGELPVLILIDTLARNFGPGNENATQDMNLFVQALDRLKDATRACVITVHHTGHAEKERARGSMALKGALDAEFRVHCVTGQLDAEGVIQMTCTANKDAAPPVPRAFRAIPHIVDLLPDGENITSLALQEEEMPEPETGGRRMPPTVRNAVAAFLEVCEPKTMTATDEQWREAFYCKSTASTQGSKRATYNRVKQDIQNGGGLRVIGEDGFSYQLTPGKSQWKDFDGFVSAEILNREG